jgi:hypothetical protein
MGGKALGLRSQIVKESEIQQSDKEGCLHSTSIQPRAIGAGNDKKNDSSLPRSAENGLTWAGQSGLFSIYICREVIIGGQGRGTPPDAQGFDEEHTGGHPPADDAECGYLVSGQRSL